MTDDFAHGFTYSGHPVACAVALKNIQILEQEGIVDVVAQRTGPYFQARLAELADHPLVGEVRGSGLIAGIELVEDKAKRRHFDTGLRVGGQCRNHCLANGLIMRAIRDIMVLAPPLIITTDEIDFIIEQARIALNKTADQLATAT